MSTISRILEILVIINGIHVVILAWIERRILFKIGKRDKIFGIGKMSDKIDLIKAAWSEPEHKKYKKFAVYNVCFFILEIILFLLLIFSFPIARF